MIQEKDLSPQVLAALGHSPEDPLESLIKNEHSSVGNWLMFRKLWPLKTHNNIIPFPLIPVYTDKRRIGEI
jgi:hypothetical protein